ncbi:hypothetical protein CTI12_AA273080 [Artemisia annua]|uniref:P-type ATPase N-terminal domain-containing protein n=1 Tax=Artemisia annua TaxID=35608 RepID=A0A2U1NF83_ARTAN|nr:hypothetical protein CTI12_AA273080 [Artemisia annua]
MSKRNMFIWTEVKESERHWEGGTKRDENLENGEHREGEQESLADKQNLEHTYSSNVTFSDLHGPGGKVQVMVDRTMDLGLNCKLQRDVYLIWFDQGNAVSKTKYNLFFPKGLYEQFRRVANQYSLTISCLSFTPVRYECSRPMNLIPNSCQQTDIIDWIFEQKVQYFRKLLKEKRTFRRVTGR